MRVGKEIASRIKEISIKLYEEAANFALTKGIIIADTKFEFGLDENGVLTLDPIYTESPEFDTYAELEAHMKAEYSGYTKVGADKADNATNEPTVLRFWLP